MPPLLALLLAACEGRHEVPRHVQLRGDPDRGALLIRQFSCGACHTIPGVRGARGLVGPPLTSFAERTYIAGQLPNTARNLERWLRDRLRWNPAPPCRTWVSTNRARATWRPTC